MADFITRLAERALGVASVVQPLVPSVFAPEPASYSLDVEWDSQAVASSDVPARVRATPAQQTPSASHVLEAMPEDTAAQSEVQSASAHITPRPSGISDVSPELHHPAGSGTSERGTTSGQEDQSTAVPTAPNHPQRMPGADGSELSDRSVASEQEGRSAVAPAAPSQRAPDAAESGQLKGRAASGQEEDRRDSPPAPIGSPGRTPGSRPGPSHLDVPVSLERRATFGKDRQDPSPATARRRPQAPPEPPYETLDHPGPGPAPRDTLSVSQRELIAELPSGSPSTKDEAEETVPRLIGTLVYRGSGATALLPRPGSGVQASPEVSVLPLEPEPIPDRPTPPDNPYLVAPGTVRPRLSGHQERGLREPRAAVPEAPAPTIRVAIGRIEVRAITPPPAPPARRAAPLRPIPALSLDDYLRQRNGDRR